MRDAPETQIARESTSRRLGFSVVELFVVLAILATLIAFMLPAVRNARPAAFRTECRNKLRSIAIALRNYQVEFNAYPPAYTVDAEGRRLHSWRTLILPYLDQKHVYDKIDLSKPWDDPANAEAFKTVINVYRCPMTEREQTNTTYLAVVTPDSYFQPTRGRKLSEFSESAGSSLILIEVSSKNAVHWMSPNDADEKMILELQPDADLPHERGMHAAFADGSARFLSAELTAAERRALISITGDDN